MSNEAYAFALQNALTEIRNLCPSVQASFVFDEKAALVAGDGDTPADKVESVVAPLEGIMEKAEAIGGLHSLVIGGGKGNVQISRVGDMYLAMIASKNADMKYLEIVARVLIPTVIKLIDSLDSKPFEKSRPTNALPRRWAPKEETVLKETVTETNVVEESEKDEDELVSELELPPKQLIVESFGGLLVRGDTVQLSEDVVSRWKELSSGKEIASVEIEAFNGESRQCKLKTLDSSKLRNQAVIRIPEKVCRLLNVEKGELVRVKPIIE